eukprot:s958_g8.t1
MTDGQPGEGEVQVEVSSSQPGCSCCQKCLFSCCSILFLLSLLELVLASLVGLALAIALSLMLLLTAMLYLVLLRKANEGNAPRCRFWFRLLLGILAAPLAFLCMLALGIHLQTFFNAAGWERFPESCPVRGCCRWSLSKASCREDPAVPLLIANVTVEEVLEEIQTWVESNLHWPEQCIWVQPQAEEFPLQYGSAVIAGRTFLRASCSTTTWKFVDDIAWRLSDVTCGQSPGGVAMGCRAMLFVSWSGVLVEVHSQQRAGIDDGCHNMYRVRFSMGHLNETFPAMPFDEAC